MSIRTVSGKKSTLFALFFTFAVDNLGATIVFPIFAPLFLDPEKGLLPGPLGVASRETLLGFFLAAFPLTQFFFAPFLGDYSDHYGRRRALIISTGATFLGFSLSALSIQNHYLMFLFIGRLIMGIGAGNLSICMSALSDLSETGKEKRHYFSLGSAIAGITFVLGPFIGGKLSDPTLSDAFNPAFPMWIGGILSAINILFLLFSFQETLDEESHKKFDFFKGIKSISLVLKIPMVRILFIIYFLYLFAWNIFFQFLPAYAVTVFGFSSSTIGDVAALMGLFWVFGTMLVYKVIHRFICDKWLLFSTLGLFAIGTGCIPFSSEVWVFVLIIALCTILSGVIWPLCTGVLSDSTPRRLQGKTLGISQSLLSLSMLIAAITGGISLEFNITVPFLAGAGTLVLAGLLVFLCQLPDE